MSDVKNAFLLAKVERSCNREVQLLVVWLRIAEFSRILSLWTTDFRLTSVLYSWFLSVSVAGVFTIPLGIPSER
ncbi:hypothetical protein K435DRAFT_783126 [Dendrothele bispora CBS 962.96]|uniref:Uncharacterized protein n=1 Tax=Dendrothele bispora (strain CBS 962.96) TaxID=1314807 RepID=A0A4S8LAL7_DENBC|nr:hypothetical protein K435DRAFT_783126 [Dendrothele bispora CBS 962.96]